MDALTLDQKKLVAASAGPVPGEAIISDEAVVPSELDWPVSVPSNDLSDLEPEQKNHLAKAGGFFEEFVFSQSLNRADDILTIQQIRDQTRPMNLAPEQPLVKTRRYWRYPRNRIRRYCQRRFPRGYCRCLAETSH